MGYRRSPADSQAQRRWRGFRHRHRELIVQTALPGAVLDREDTWMDFLEHGYLDHHEDPTRTTVEQLDADAYRALCRVVRLYVDETGRRLSLMALRPEDRVTIEDGLDRG